MSRIMTKDELMNAYFNTKSILTPWNMVYMRKLINGEYSILDDNYLVNTRISLLHNLPLYHEIAKYNLYNILLNSFESIKEQYESYPLTINNEKDALQLATIADGVCYPIVSCMFFDRFKRELPFYEESAIHVASISIFTREMYSIKERFNLYKQSQEVEKMLLSMHPTINEDPLVNAKRKERRALFEDCHTSISLNNIINTCASEFFQDNILPTSEVLREQNYVDGSCITFKSSPEVLVKKFVDKI